MNDIQISRSNSLYSIRSYFNRMLGYTPQQKNTILKGEGYYNDTGDVEEVTDKTKNIGFKDRMGFAKQKFFLCGKLVEGFLNQHRYLIPNVSLKIRLRRTPPAFYILQKTLDNTHPLDAKIVISNAILHLRNFQRQSSRQQFLLRITLCLTRGQNFRTT